MTVIVNSSNVYKKFEIPNLKELLKKKDVEYSDSFYCYIKNFNPKCQISFWNNNWVIFIGNFKLYNLTYNRTENLS